MPKVTKVDGETGEANVGPQHRARCNDDSTEMPYGSSSVREFQGIMGYKETTSTSMSDETTCERRLQSYYLGLYSASPIHGPSSHPPYT